MDGQLGFEAMALLGEPVCGMGGEWGTAGGAAVRESLSRGSWHGVMDVLDALHGAPLAAVLRETGFEVAESAVEQGRDAILAYVGKDLLKAVEQRADGFEVRAGREGREKQVGGFAAKGFGGDVGAFRSIQAVLSAPGVQVDFLGDSLISARPAMLCIAGEAMRAGVQGFGFEGMPGKFEVPCSLKELVDLHVTAAAAVAVESVGEAIDDWRAERKVGELPGWIPDSVQRLVQGSLSENSAHMLVRAMEEKTIGKYAAEAGLHSITRTLAAQGLDINAPTIAAQADALGLQIVEPDRQRGKYVGPVVGTDHRACLLKYARASGVEVPFTGLASGQARPEMGDMARVEFNKGAMTVKTTEHVHTKDMGR